MPLQLIVLGIVAMAALATLRVIRVHQGRTPLPDGRGRRLFLIGFVVVPPIVLGGIGALPMYVAIIAMLAILMWAAAVVVGLVTSSRAGQIARLGLIGREADPNDARLSPKVTAELAESLRIVDRANAVFPRGAAFPAQISRAGFRADWDVLDGATQTLEGRIAGDHRLGLVVASAATATADDARSRLDTLRRLAGDEGQAWAVA
jgi:hypothetical protein